LNPHFMWGISVTYVVNLKRLLCRGSVPLPLGHRYKGCTPEWGYCAPHRPAVWWPLLDGRDEVTEYSRRRPTKNTCIMAVSAYLGYREHTTSDIGLTA
jgi:hypothetical protein